MTVQTTPQPAMAGQSWYSRSPGEVTAAVGVDPDVGLTLSPVSADSSICRALAAMMRPSAGTSSPAAMSTTSPTTT